MFRFQSHCKSAHVCCGDSSKEAFGFFYLLEGGDGSVSSSSQDRMVLKSVYHKLCTKCTCIDAHERAIPLSTLGLVGLWVYECCTCSHFGEIA